MHMKSGRKLSILAATAITAALVLIPASRAASPNDPATGAALPAIIAPLLDAVVNITILKSPTPIGHETDGTFLADRKWERGFGSGFIISPDGIVVTNRHVIADAVKVTITTHDERQFDARMLSANTTPDLALLQIEGAGPFATVQWGDSDALRLGETVIAVGNPLGLTTSITVGVVSALNRNVRSSLIDDYIQTDAAINRGSSGGPLFNLKGEVVGVHWAMITPSEQSGSVGLGLAIPSETAAMVIAQMRRHGRLNAGFPGMALQPMTPNMARVLKLPDASGGIVTAISAGGPAERAGVREGDVILQLGPRMVEDARAMLRELVFYPPGTQLPLRIRRAGMDLLLDIELTTFPPEYDPVGPPPLADLGRRVDDGLLGLRVSELTPATRRAFKVKHERPGVVVEGVAANSRGAAMGLSRGDILLRVGDSQVPTPEALAAALQRHRHEGGALMQVEMDGRMQWVVVPPP